MLAAAVYLLAVLGANLTATLFVPFPVFGQVAIGTFIFGLTFTQRDRMHARGRGFVYAVIALSALLSLALLLSVRYLWGAHAAELLRAAGQAWLAGGLEELARSGPRVFAASVIAILLAESADTEVFHRLRKRSWMLKVLSSNAVGIPLDSILFNLIAFGGVFAPLLLVQIIFGEIVVKFAVSFVYALWHTKRTPLPALT